MYFFANTIWLFQGFFLCIQLFTKYSEARSTHYNIKNTGKKFCSPAAKKADAVDVEA